MLNKSQATSRDISNQKARSNISYNLRILHHLMLDSVVTRLNCVDSRSGTTSQLGSLERNILHHFMLQHESLKAYIKTCKREVLERFYLEVLTVRSYPLPLCKVSVKKGTLFLSWKLWNLLLIQIMLKGLALELRILKLGMLPIFNRIICI